MRLITIVPWLSLALISGAAMAKDEDNTIKNRPGMQASGTNAGMQSQDEADVKLTAQIRRNIMEDKGLSVYAQNVKIVTRQGQVELVGPVRNDKEKAAVEDIAERIAGKANVRSAITLAPTGR